jgi:Calcineurin-like phosphoesterase.
MRLAAITDVHALSPALSSAIAAARQEGFDRMIIMGDLLTYGVTPQETLDLVHDAVTNHAAVILKGNHDCLYLDLISKGRSDYLDKLPDWLRASVEWTAERIDGAAFAAQPWRETWGSGSLLAAHANPFAFGDWTYLENDETLERAADAVGRAGARHGIFGHTHRRRSHTGKHSQVHVLAALGQPRDLDDPVPQWTMIDLQGDNITLSPRRIDFDRDAHRRAIAATSLPSETKSRLCKYFM